MRHIWGVLEIVGTVYADSLKSMATSTIDAAPTHCVNSLMMSASGAMPANLTDISKLNKGGKWHEKILYINWGCLLHRFVDSYLILKSC